jgi:hypothetical protein
MSTKLDEKLILGINCYTFEILKYENKALEN